MIGKRLGRDEELRANRIYEFLQELSKRCEVELEKCEMCEGTGLQGVSKLYGEGGYSWDGRFCELCNGTGYKQKCHKDLLFVCRNCNGNGCEICNYKGIVDWVTYLRGIKK